jgi:hypothetical protein
MGKPWTEQKSTHSPLQVIRMFRDAVRVGALRRADTDHNSRYYKGLSNKNIKIIGAILLDNPAATFDEAWDAVAEAAVGPASE